MGSFQILSLPSSIPVIYKLPLGYPGPPTTFPKFHASLSMISFCVKKHFTYFGPLLSNLRFC